MEDWEVPYDFETHEDEPSHIGLNDDQYVIDDCHHPEGWLEDFECVAKHPITGKRCVLDENAHIIHEDIDENHWFGRE